jgi:hypothetical protein
MGEKRRNFALLVISVLAALLLAEGALRLSGMAAMTARFMCFDALMGKVYCESAEGTFSRGSYTHHLVINSDGMVDREHPLAAPGDTLRVALLGDSFTASEYLPVEQKFEGILEQELSRSLDQPVEILNFGISAIDTWNQLQIFHLKSARYRPDLTLLAFFWGNDIRDNIEQLQSGNPNPLLDEYDAPFAARLRQARKNFNKQLWNHSLLYQVVHEGWGRLERSVKQRLAPAYLREIDRLILTGDRQDSTAGEVADVVDTGYNDDDVFFWNSAGWEVTRQLIVKLNADVEAAGSRLVVMHFPSEGLVRGGVPLPHPEFDAFLEQNGIPYVSLFPGYQAMDAGELRSHFIPGDGHWTPHGHRHVAQQTTELLLDALSGP